MKRLHRWWVYIVVLALIVVILALIPIDEEGIAKFGLLTTVALVAVTATYAASAHEQAEASKKMAEEMMQQRYTAVMPVVDIQEPREGEHPRAVAERAYQIRGGENLENLPCVLQNIGLGPAVDVCSCIFFAGQRRMWDIGTLGVSKETDRMPLSIEQKNGQSILVAYYRDVYGQSFESSREVIIDQAGSSYKIGSLKIRKLTAEEYAVALRS
jgi:hypothetical protein